MKYLFSLLLVLTGLLISSHSVAQGSLAALDAKNGFKDAKFGMPFAAFEGLVLDETQMNGGRRKYYRGPVHNNVLGSTKLDYIQYSFYDGELDKIVFVAEGKSNCINVLQAVQSVYGLGSMWPTEMGIDWKAKKVYLMASLWKLKDGSDYYRFEMGKTRWWENTRKVEIKRIANDL